MTNQNPNSLQPYVHNAEPSRADLALPGDTSRHPGQITILEDARTAGEASLMAPSTYRTEWASDSSHPTTNFSITEPGATFSSTFLGPEIEENATCLVVQTETTNEDGSVDRAAYATDFSTLIALPMYDPRKGTFGTEGEKVQAWRAGRHPAPVDRDLVVGQSLFGRPGKAVVTAVVMPEAVMGFTTVFDRVRYDNDDGVILWHSDRPSQYSSGPYYTSGPVGSRQMPLRRRAESNPVESAYAHLSRVKTHYERLEAADTAATGRTAIAGS